MYLQTIARALELFGVLIHLATSTASVRKCMDLTTCPNWKVSGTAEIGKCQNLFRLENARNCSDLKGQKRLRLESVIFIHMHRKKDLSSLAKASAPVLKLRFLSMLKFWLFLKLSPELRLRNYVRTHSFLLMAFLVGFFVGNSPPLRNQSFG